MFLVRSSAIEGFEALVAELGANPVKLLTQVGLTPSRLQDPNHFIGFKQLVELLELTSDACREPLFGLLLSRRHTSSILGDLAVYLFHQPTVSDAIRGINRHLYLHVRGLTLEYHEADGYLQIAMKANFNSALGIDQFMQLAVGHLTNYLIDLLGHQELRFPVLLQQARPSEICDRLDAKFLSMLRFERRESGAMIPLTWLNHRPAFDDAIFRRQLDGQLKQLEKSYPNNTEDQVKEIIGQFLCFSECSLEKVAAIMGVHPRTMQEQLAACGTRYVAILNQVRTEQAQRYLRAGLPVTEVAYLLGFSDISVFSSAFRRWTGISPKRWQKTQLNSSSESL